VDALGVRNWQGPQPPASNLLLPREGFTPTRLKSAEPAQIHTRPSAGSVADNALQNLDFHWMLSRVRVIDDLFFSPMLP
jgi:hypothetical protein